MQMSFADFILQHEGDDPVRLLLARDKYPEVDIDLAVTTLEVRRKLRTKVPEWYAVPSLIYRQWFAGAVWSPNRRFATPPINGPLPLMRPRVATGSGTKPLPQMSV